MAMLAEPRRRQKWTMNPRGRHWSDDSNKYGQKMLEKMGWTSGKGLGANLDGMTEHVRLKYKNDQAGIGFSHNDREKQWTEHHKGFDELLQQLRNNEAAETTTTAYELSGKSLELKSKQSRARVHYQKFTRGKDVNKYNTKDIANIFGKKDLDEKSHKPEKAVEIKQEPEEPRPELVGCSDSSHGVVTIKGGSITDYFKNKMSALSRKVPTEVPNNSDTESETHVGFGFSACQKKIETPTKSPGAHLSRVNFAFDIASSKEAKDTPKQSKQTPRKRNTSFVFDNPALQLGDSTTEMECTPNRWRSEFVFENGGLDLEYPQNCETACAISFSEDVTKKKRKKKVKESIAPVVEGFTNEALNLESRDDDNSSSNQFEVPRMRLGLANDALDLTDETNGRKRVTFNEAVEYDMNVGLGKCKHGGKLDKFEVDNKKMKRKKKMGRKNEVSQSAFVNEAMDIDAVSQEVNENAANERKSDRARRKRDRRMSNLDTIAEVPDEDNESVVQVVTLDGSFVGEASEDLEVLSLEIPKKKRKTRNTRETIKLAENQQNKNVSTMIDISEENVEFVEEILVFDSGNTDKKSKKNKELQEGENAMKRAKRKKKDPVTGERKGVVITEVQVETAVKAKKEKTKRTVVTGDAKENMDTQNVVAVVEGLEEVVSANMRKKQRKEKKEREEEDGAGEKIEEDEKQSLEVENLENGAQSPSDAKIKKSRRTFKALFARSPVVNFVGSNIKEIKGYGMDLK